MPKLLFSKQIPAFDRVLMIESGSRHLVENLLDSLYGVYPGMRFDLVTCYAASPRSFRPGQGEVFRIADFTGAAGRARLYAQLQARRYTVMGIICSGEPIMTKWKWALFAQVPAKVFILNENGDYFWLDYSNWKTVRHFLLFRSGLAGGGAVLTLGRLLLFPFTFAYLLLYAGAAHLRRWFRLRATS